jgi:hypothetical protein
MQVVALKVPMMGILTPHIGFTPGFSHVTSQIRKNLKKSILILIP